MRISKPVRSSKCSHLQCFDARWWLEANKSHPQWLCPRCSKELQLSDIICDGYFLSILKATPDDYDEVVLESNGDWHTADGNYGTAEWLAANGGGTAATTAEPEPVKRARSTSVDGDSPPAKRAAIEILSDSDDSDEVPLKTVSVGPGFAPKAPATAVIDLTLSDSDSDSDYEPPAQTVRRPPPQPPRNGGAAAAPPAQERRFAAPPSQTLPPPSQTLPPPPEPEVGAFSFSDALRMGLDMSRAHGGAPVHCPTLPPVLVSAEQLALPGNHLPHPNGQYLPHPAGPQGHMPMRTTYPPNGH
jgi:hypothetical protein